MRNQKGEHMSVDYGVKDIKTLEGIVRELPAAAHLLTE